MIDRSRWADVCHSYAEWLGTMIQLECGWIDPNAAELLILVSDSKVR